jgi:hypothetical protein
VSIYTEKAEKRKPRAQRFYRACTF